jgi:hypothetical protein
MDAETATLPGMKVEALLKGDRLLGLFGMSAGSRKWATSLAGGSTCTCCN